jgi:acetylornithine deacetylase/succinyl-diaminopimelate desuccinylase-like protein
MDPDKVLAGLRAHLDKGGYSDIEIKVYNKYPWSKLSLDEPVVQAMIRTYRALHGELQLWPINPGSAPYYVFERLLGLPYVTGGLGHGSRQHSSNEYCTVAGILDFEQSMVVFLDEFTRAPLPQGDEHA